VIGGALTRLALAPLLAFAFAPSLRAEDAGRLLHYERIAVAEDAAMPLQQCPSLLRPTA
jgi:hypothetical protein